MATCLAAGLYGIEHEIEPRRLPQRGDASAGGRGRTRPCRARSPRRPRCSPRARRRARSWAQPFVDHYVRTRDWEVRQYERAVTDWELRRYFEAIWCKSHERDHDLELSDAGPLRGAAPSTKMGDEAARLGGTSALCRHRQGRAKSGALGARRGGARSPPGYG